MSLRNLIPLFLFCLSPIALAQSTVNGQGAHVVTTTTINSNPCVSESTCLIANTAQHITGAEMFLNMLPQFISGSTIADSSGNGNSATICSGGNAPTQTTLGLFFNGFASGTTTSCVNLPAAVNNLRTIEFAFNIPPGGSSNGGSNASILVPNTSGAAAPLFFLSAPNGTGWTSTPGLSLWKYGVANETASNVLWTSGNHTLVVTLGTNCTTDKDHVYYDGVEISPYTAQGCDSGLMTSGNWVLGASPSYLSAQAAVTQYEVIAYSSELTAAQVAQEHAAMSSDVAARGAGAIGVQWNLAGPAWFAYGDSLTYCQQATIGADCWVNQPPAPAPTFQVTNLGNAGKTADFIMSTNAGTSYSNCQTSSGPNIATVMDGTNNFALYSGSTPANTAAYIANQVQILAQAGCKVFVGTMISRGGGAPTNGQTWNQNQFQLDAIIRSNWKAWGAVGILDFAADPNLGCAACNANGTYYYTDNIHLINAGYLLMQAAAWQSMDYYFGYTKSNPNFIVQTVTGATATIGSASGAVGNATAQWSVVYPTPLIAGPISQIVIDFFTAPAAVPITFALATGTAPSFTNTPSSSFTITPAATSGVQTFVAGTGFTAPLSSVAGDFIQAWSTSAHVGYQGSGQLYFLSGQSSLPSGAHTYTSFGGNMAVSVTITNPPVTTTTYNMLASDGYIELNTTGVTAAETLILPSCIGQSGAEYTIGNQTAQTVTLKNLNSAQPINGTDYSTTGLTLTTSATAGKFTITDVPNLLGTTSGCHWSF